MVVHAVKKVLFRPTTAPLLLVPCLLEWLQQNKFSIFAIYTWMIFFLWKSIGIYNKFFLYYYKRKQYLGTYFRIKNFDP